MANQGPLLDQDEDENVRDQEKRQVVLTLSRTRVCDVAKSMIGPMVVRFQVSSVTAAKLSVDASCRVWLCGR